MKKTLVYQHDDDLSFVTPWIRPLLEPYFDFEVYCADKTYNLDQHIGLISHASLNQPGAIASLRSQGYRVIVDHLWDSDVSLQSKKLLNRFILHCANWMWYYTSIEFAHHKYNQYCAQRTGTHSFLMLMRSSRWQRDRALEALSPLLPRALYSYIDRQIYIANDRPQTDPVPYQSYMNPTWYNSTTFSVVVETWMRNSQPGSMRTEVSEKIFKPMSHLHPFVVYGSVDTLAYLKQQGFETFDNWFDQGYDSIVNDQARFSAVTTQVFDAVDRWQKNELGFDTETNKKLQHNQNHLFDHAIVLPRFYQEIIEPILEYAETR